MPDVLRIKRRLAGGAAGAPTSLAAAEIAFNEQDLTLYYGSGNSGGVATVIIPIAGSGAFLRLTGGTLSGGLSFGGAPAPGGVTDLSRHIQLHTAGYGLNVTASRQNYVAPIGAAHWFNVNTVDVASITATGLNATAVGATTPSTGSFTTLAASGAVSGAGFTTLLTPYAPLASPALTGTPTAPSAAIGTSDTTIANTLFVNRMAAGYILNTATDADTTLTAAQVGSRVIRFSGALTADRTYTLPSAQQRSWFLYNNTTGGFTLNFTIGGTAVAIPAGLKTEVYNDSASMFFGANYVGAGQLRIGPPANNAFTFTSGATTSTAATIDLTGTGALQFLVGFNFGSTLASSTSDLTRHITLYSTAFGFCVTTSRLNYNAGAAAAHVFVCGGTDVGSVNVASGFVGTTPTAAPGTNTTALANTAFVTAAVAAYADDIGRNYIHNNLFRIWQRGGGAFTANGVYTADRWLMIRGADASSVSRLALADADRTALADEDAGFALQCVFTGGSLTNDMVLVCQRIEGVRRLSNRQITVSFYAQAAAGTPKVGVSADQMFGTGGSTQVLGTGTAVTLSTTWTRYSVSLTTANTAAKTLGANADDSTSINLWFSSGAGANTRAGSIGVQSGTIRLWGLQVEIGVITALEKIDFTQDWENCQRFYQAVNLGFSTYQAAGSLFGYYVVFPVAMQRIPTVTVNSPTYTNASAGAATAASTFSFFAQATTTALGSCSFFYQYQASADL